MTTNKPLFRFNARAVESDPTGYYVTRWDRALPVSVIARNRDEAFEKVETMMGEPTRHGAWAVRIDSAEEIVNDAINAALQEERNP